MSGNAVITYEKLDCKTMRFIKSRLMELGGKYWKEAFAGLSVAQRKALNLRWSAGSHYRRVDVCQETGWSEYMVMTLEIGGLHRLAGVLSTKTGTCISIEKS